MFGGKDKYYEYTENFWKKYLRNRSYLQKPELKVGEERQGKGATHSWPSRSARNTQDQDPCSPDGVYFRPGMALGGRGREEQRDRTELTRRRRKDRYRGSSADVGKVSGPMGQDAGSGKAKCTVPISRAQPGSHAAGR